MQIDTIEKLEALYGTPGQASLVKVADRITPQYRAWIEAAPFCALTTVGPEGTDCSPRGDAGQVAYVESETCVAIPDRRGNNRIDALRNIVRDPRCSLMFLIPGSGTVIRINGHGRIMADPDRLQRYTTRGAAPRSVLVIEVGEVYFQCARAVMRAKLWTGTGSPAGLPSPGEILQSMSQGDIDGDVYDTQWPGRAAKSMW